MCVSFILFFKQKTAYEMRISDWSSDVCSSDLLHGSQPDVFVVCHDPARKVILGMESFALPSIEEVIDLTIRLGSRTNPAIRRSEEHTSELQSLMRISYAVFCLKKKNKHNHEKSQRDHTTETNLQLPQSV